MCPFVELKFRKIDIEIKQTKKKTTSENLNYCKGQSISSLKQLNK